MLTMTKEDNKFENYQTEFLKACNDKEQLQLLIKEVKDAAKIVCDKYFVINQYNQSMQTIYDFDSHRFHVISELLPKTKRYKHNHSYVRGDYISFGYGGNKTKLMTELLDIAKRVDDSQVYSAIDKVNGFDKLTKYLISNLKRIYTNKYQKIVLRHNQCDLTESFVIDSFCGTARADILSELWNERPTQVNHAMEIYLTQLEHSTFKTRYGGNVVLNTNEDVMSPENIVREVVCATCVQGFDGYSEEVINAAFTLQIPDEFKKIQMWVNRYFNETKWNAVLDSYITARDCENYFFKDLLMYCKTHKNKQTQLEVIQYIVLNNLLNINHYGSSALTQLKIVNFDALIQFCKDINSMKWKGIPQKYIYYLHRLLSDSIIGYLKSTNVKMYLKQNKTKIKQLLSVFPIDDKPLEFDTEKNCLYVTDFCRLFGNSSTQLNNSDVLYHWIECTGKQFVDCIANKLSFNNDYKLDLTILSILHFKLTDINTDEFTHLIHTIALTFDNSDEMLSTLNKMYTSGNIILKGDVQEDVTLF